MIPTRTTDSSEGARRRIKRIGLVCGIIGIIIAAVLVYRRAALNVKAETLSQARSGFVTQLTIERTYADPLPVPPAGFSIVRYHAPLGSYPAIIARPTGRHAATANGKHPAIIWLGSQGKNEIDSTPWAPQYAGYDISAKAFHEAGILTMYPSMRGGNGNQGVLEAGFGEVDDVLAAARYLASRPDVDRDHIYLGGFGIGGTIALLTSECSGMFRAVFSFGPRADMADYALNMYDDKNARERQLRAPYVWLSSIVSPTYVIEGDDPLDSYINSLRKMRDACTNPAVSFIEVHGYSHFNEMERTTPIIAQKIVGDAAPKCNIVVEESDWPEPPPR